MITQQRLKEVLSYDPETGNFVWREDRNGFVRAGERAGWDQEGYIRIEVDYHAIFAHRLAWLSVYGYLPSNQIDHINLVRSDNRICNLRQATNSQNKMNSKLKSTNTTGFKGVSFHKRDKKYTARATVKGKINNLGYHDTPEEAHAAYCKFIAVHHGEFGRNQ